MLSTAEDFLKYSHRNEKYSIVGLNLKPVKVGVNSKCIIGLGSRTTALIFNNYISDIKVRF